jgi:transposase
MPSLPDVPLLSDAEKDALIDTQQARIADLMSQVADLHGQVEALSGRIRELESRLGGQPAKDSSNSSKPPSQDQKSDKPQSLPRQGARTGSLGRKGGGRSLAENPDQTVIAKATSCAHCHTPFDEADQTLCGRYDKIDIPPVRPITTRVERYAGHCRCCGQTTAAPVPDGLEEGSPFGPNIVAIAIYLRTVHAISYQRLNRLFAHLFGLSISEGALDAAFRRVHPLFADQTAVILARLRRSRLVCSDETGIRVQGKNAWNWTFQNKDVVLHVIRNTRSAAVVEEIMAGHKPQFWVSDLYGAQQGHAVQWQVCLAHQLRDCQYAIDRGDTVFAPRMKALFLRAFKVAQRRKTLTDSTLKRWKTRLDQEVGAALALDPTQTDGKRLRKRYAKVRNSLFTFLEDRELPPDNNGSEREIRPVATYRKVTGGFRSKWGPDFFANVKSTIGTAARKGINAFQSIVATLQGKPVLTEA